MASYKVRRHMLAMRGARMGYTTSDYVDISACGQVILAGSIYADNRSVVHNIIWLCSFKYLLQSPKIINIGFEKIETRITP